MSDKVTKRIAIRETCGFRTPEEFLYGLKNTDAESCYPPTFNQGKEKVPFYLWGGKKYIDYIDIELPVPAPIPVPKPCPPSVPCPPVVPCPICPVGKVCPPCPVAPPCPVVPSCPTIPNGSDDSCDCNSCSGSSRVPISGKVRVTVDGVTKHFQFGFRQKRSIQ